MKQCHGREHVVFYSCDIIHDNKSDLIASCTDDGSCLVFASLGDGAGKYEIANCKASKPISTALNDSAWLIIPGDINGDGKAGLTVSRPSSGEWLKMFQKFWGR